MDFLTPNEKVKKYRKMLKMTQNEFETENFTRAFLSMIESGKRGFKKDTANIIAEKLNAKAEQLGLTFKIDADHLLNSPKEDAETYCSKSLNTNPTEIEIKKIIEIGETYNLNNILSKSNILLGDLYFNSNKFLDALIYFDKAYEFIKKIETDDNIIYIYKMIGLCKLNLLQYNEAIFYLERSHLYSSYFNKVNEYTTVLYNLALCYKKLSHYQLAIKYANEFINYCNKSTESSHYIYANILKANCCEDLNDTNSSIEILNKLLNEIKDIQPSQLALIQNNLALIYVKTKDFEKSLIHFQSSEELRKQNDRPNLSHTLIEKYIIFVKQGKLQAAIDLLLIGIDLAKEYNDFEWILKGYYRLAHIYTDLNEFTEAEKIYLYMVDTLKQTDNKLALAKVYSHLASAHLQQNNIEMSKFFLNLSQNTYGKSSIFVI
jgi:tetratricopeptide (TPR) repeat protein